MFSRARPICTPSRRRIISRIDSDRTAWKSAAAPAGAAGLRHKSLNLKPKHYENHVSGTRPTRVVQYARAVSVPATLKECLQRLELRERYARHACQIETLQGLRTLLVSSSRSAIPDGSLGVVGGLVYPRPPGASVALFLLTLPSSRLGDPAPGEFGNPESSIPAEAINPAGDFVLLLIYW